MEKVKRKRDPGQFLVRVLSTGLNVTTYSELIRRTEIDLRTFQRNDNPEDFIDACIELAEAECTYAKEQLALGHDYAAGEALYNASQLYKFADYGLLELTEEKVRNYEKCSNCFREGVQLLAPHKHYSVDIPFDGNFLPGILTVPANATADVPVVITMPGATGFKEEVWGMLGRIHNSGLATLIFDGPGQGEALYARKILYEVDNYERAVGAVIDFVKQDSRVGDKVALYGHSYGGYLSARGACFNNDKINCIVARGGCSKTTELVKGNYIKKFKMKLRETDDAGAMSIIEQMTIEPHVQNITVPLLVIQGDTDHIYGSTDGSKYIYEHASSKDKTYYEVKGGNHGGGLSLQTEHYLANWLKDHLL